MIAQPNGQGGVLAPTSGTQGGVGGPSSSPPGGSPKRQQRQINPNTFAGMQQQGVARPSPQLLESQAAANRLTAMNQQMQQQASPYQPTAQSAMQAAQRTVDNASAGQNMGRFEYGGSANALGAPLMQQVMSLLNDPTQGLNEAAESNFDRQNRTLGREFTTLREGMNENMAARGLDASTIAATKLGELGSRQAEAQADMSARIQEKLISDRAAAMQAAISSAMGLRGQEADMEESLFTINRDTAAKAKELGMAEQRFGLDAELGRGNLSLGQQRLSLDGELGRGNLAINQGQLGLAQDRLGFDRSRDSRDFTYQQGRDSTMDQRYDDRFAYDKGIDQRDFTYKQGRDTIGDSQVDRAFNYGVGRDNKLDTRYDERFAYDKSRDTSGDEYRDRRDNTMDKRYDDRFTYDKGRDSTMDQRYDDRFTYDKSRDTKNDDYRTGRDKYNDGRDTKNDDYRAGRDKYNDGRDQKNDDYRTGRDKYNDGRDQKNDDYRTGRDTVEDGRWNKTYDQNDRNITTQGIGSILNGLGYKNIPKSMLDSIMSSLGISTPSGSTPPGSPPPPSNPYQRSSNDDSGDYDEQGNYIFAGGRPR